MGNAGSDQVLDDPTRILEGPAQPGAWTPEDADPNVTGRVRAVTGQYPAIGVSLDQHEVPFPQPDPRSALLERPLGWDWRRAADRIGGRPVAGLVGMTLLAVLFAAFISRNSQSLTDDLDARLAEAGDRATGESSVSTSEGSGLFAGSAGSEAVGGQGRSTGAAGDFDPVDHYNGQLIEPDDELTTDRSWVTTTLPATTVSTTVTSGTETSSSTVPATSTTQPETTTAPPPGGPVAVAVSPGRSSSENPELITSDEVLLQAEGQGEDLQYRFFVYRWDERRERWELDDRSRWRSRSWVRLKTGRYLNETVRWTVMVRDGDREESPESAPLYFRVKEEKPEAIVPDVANGGFEGTDMGDRNQGIFFDGQVSGWSSSVGVIEVWTNGFDPAVQAASGSQFIELNSVAPSTISQVIDVSPGSTVQWSLAHQSRAVANEAIEVMVRPAGGNGSWSDAFTAPLGSWVRHEGRYEVPDGVDRIELRIRSVTGGSAANFIDDVRVELIG